ncbi:MAG: formate dehydrogenase accessory sulfurtransferase FdhD [Thermoanaerobaculia bacterium]
MEPTERVRVRSREGEKEKEREDVLAVEEPLEIRARPGLRAPAVSFVTTMRTPGRDEDLTAGLLFAEGVLESRDDLKDLAVPDDPRLETEMRGNVLLATLSPEAFARAEKLRRGTVMGSACGVCGRTSIESVIRMGELPLHSDLRVTASLLRALPERLAARQSLFAATGGLHAAALFDREGRLLELAEDIGRHNATDKLVGHFLRRRELPLSDSLLMVSGRAGFEIVQKAYLAGIPIVAAVSAPSSLAVALAESAGITLVGFLRGERFNLYTHPRRIG